MAFGSGSSYLCLVTDPEIRDLLDKAEELKTLSELLISQAKRLSQQAEQIIEKSKELGDTNPHPKRNGNRR